MGMDPDVISFDDLPDDNALPKAAAPQGAPDVIGFDDLPDEMAAQAPAQAPLPSAGLGTFADSVGRSYNEFYVQRGLADRVRIEGMLRELDAGGNPDINPVKTIGDGIKMDIGRALGANVETPEVKRQYLLNRLGQIDQEIKSSDAAVKAYGQGSQQLSDLQAGLQEAQKQDSFLSKTGSALSALYNNAAGIPELIGGGAYTMGRPIVAGIGAAALSKGRTLVPMVTSAAVSGVDSYDGTMAEIIEQKGREGGIDVRKNPEAIPTLLQDAGFIEAAKGEALRRGISDAAWSAISMRLGMSPKIKGVWQPVVQSGAEVTTELSGQLAQKGEVYDPTALPVAGVAGFGFEGPSYALGRAAGAFGKPAAPAAPQAEPTPAPAPVTPAAPDVIPFESLPSVAGETVEAPEAAPAPEPAAPAPDQPQAEAPAPAAPAPVEPRPKQPAPDAPQTEWDPYWVASKEWDAKHGKTHWIDGTPRPAKWIEGTPEYEAREAEAKARRDAEAAQAQPAPAQTPVEPTAQPAAPAPVAVEPEATPAPAPQPVATAQPAAPAQTNVRTDAEISPPQSPQPQAFQPPVEKPKKPKKPVQTEADKLRKRIEKLESFGDEKSQAQADKLKVTLAKMTGETTALAPADTPDTTAVEQKQQLYISISGKNYPVGSLPEASEKWNQFRDGVQSMGLSVNVGRTPEAQRFARKLNRGDGPVVIDQNGKVVGYISPNGKIWKNKGSIADSDLMYDPYAAEADRAKAAPKPVGMEGKPEPKTMEEFLEAKEIYEKAAKAYPEGSALNEAYMWWAREYNGEYYSQKNRKAYDAEVAAAKLTEQKAKDSVIDVEATTEPVAPVEQPKAPEPVAEQPKPKKPKKEAKPAQATAEAAPSQADLDGINDQLAEMERNKQGESPEAEALRAKRDEVQSKLEATPARNIDAEYEAAVATKKLANIDPLVKEEATRQGFTIGPVYHGTPTGGFNKFDPNRTGSNAGVSRGGPSFTTNQEAAEAYAESMDPEERSIADLVAKANEIFATIPEDAPGMVYDSTDVGDIRFDTKAVDNLESAVDSLGDYAEELRKAGYPEQAAKLEALAKEDFEGGKPEVKAVFLRLSGKPREITTTRAKMAEDLKGVRATADSPVVVNLEDGEKIYYIGNPKDIKSADAIARDDAGKVVPLSRRFQESDDLRGALDEAVIKAAEKAVPTEEGIIAALDKAAAERLRPNNLNSLGPDLVAALIWQTARDIQKGVVSFAKWSADKAKQFPSLKGSLKAIWAKAQDIAKRPMDYIRFRALDSIADKVWQNAGRNPASATLRKIANIVFAKAGPDADATENDIPTRINLVRNQFSNIYANIMERFAAEFADMTPEQRRKWDEDFRAAVIDGTTPSDPKVAQAVKDFRNLMRDMLGYQRNAGIEMGDQGANYFPRNYDADAVEADRDGFVAAAQEMYRKREERLLNKAIKDVRRAEKDRPAERRAADKKFGRKEKTDAEYQQEAAEWAQEKISALEAEFDAKDDAFYKQKAEDWATAITHGDVLGMTLFKTSEGKVTSDSTDARTFTNDEAKLADAFLKKNIDDIMMGYIDGAVRGAEVGRVFGQDGSKFEQMMNKLSAEGVDAETVKETRRLVQKALGVGREQQSQATAAFFDWVNVVLAGAFLGKTFMYNLVLEPISFGIRTGNAYLALKAMADTWRFTIAEIGTPSAATRQRLEAKYGSQAAFSKAVTETVAEQVGLIQNEMERAYFNAHWDYSSDEKGSKMAKWISQRIYRANLMSATEKAKVRASIGIARLALRDNARFFTGDAPIQKLFGALGFDTNADKSAAVIMRENGVPDADHKAFAAWVAGLEGKTDAEWQKAVMDPKDPMAKHYRRALQRMSLGMSIKTNPALKMEMSDSVLGRLMMQLMNYSYAYSNLVKDRMYSMAAQTVAKDASKIDRLRYAAPLLVGAPLAILGAAASKALIAGLWPSDDEEKRSKETPMVRKAFNWASFAGMFGPKVEYLFKSFERGQAPGGPVGETIFRSGQAVFSAAGDPDSDKKAFNAKKQLYNSTVKPVVTGAGAAAHPFFGFLGNAAVNTQAVRESVTGEQPRK